MAFSGPETAISNSILSEDKQTLDYLPVYFQDSPTIEFLTGLTSVNYHMVQTYDSLPFELPNNRNISIFLSSDQTAIYQQAKDFYPNAQFIEIKPENSEKAAAYEIRLSPSDVRSIEGLSGSYYAGSKAAGEAKLTQLSAPNLVWTDGNPLPLPFVSKWQGELYTPTYGKYSFELTSPAQATLAIDGANAIESDGGSQDVELSLAKGTHQVVLIATGGKGTFSLTWKPPSADTLGPIPNWALLAPPKQESGLLGIYFPNDHWSGPAKRIQVDPWIDYYFQTLPLEQPFSVFWSGKLRIPKEGDYWLYLNSMDASSLTIDGAPILASGIPNSLNEQYLHLKAGDHPIEIRYINRGENTSVHLQWKPPAGDRVTLPQDYLLPPDDMAEQEKKFAVENTTITGISNTPTIENSGIVSALTPLKKNWEIGDCGSGINQFKDPHGIGVDGDGNVYVVDTGNRRIVRINSQDHSWTVFDSTGLDPQKLERAL